MIPNTTYSVNPRNPDRLGAAIEAEESLRAEEPWPSNSRVYVLGDSSGAQECADLRYIGFFTPN